ncbi:Invasion protein B family [Pseudomonas carnis]|uniref:InvB/SpaK family type III secretion system chaperone n=1 Tax=Pseudomonas TaxID=286 RepID=UPI000F567593|nr:MULTISPECIES: Invasion protein B family [Pseudomonas]AZC90118.1 Type III secretion system protein BsaR [Pseudomonas chlororaphis subsp. piscium]MBY8955285.1 Invasion protein B family [Pseudomonas carnis]
MHNLDIATLLKDALNHSGCSEQQIGSFDGHSTIELEMENLPSLKIGIVDDGLWFWSTLVETGDVLLAHRSEDLLRFLMKGFDSSRTGQLQLVEVDGMLEMRAMLSESVYASPESLADGIEAYIIALTELYEIASK